MQPLVRFFLAFLPCLFFFGLGLSGKISHLLDGSERGFYLVNTLLRIAGNLSAHFMEYVCDAIGYAAVVVDAAELDFLVGIRCAAFFNHPYRKNDRFAVFGFDKDRRIVLAVLIPKVYLLFVFSRYIIK